MRFPRPALRLALAVVVALAAACAPAAAGTPGASPSIATASPSVAVASVVPSVAPSVSPTPAGPTSFTSPLYRYMVMLPAGWTASPAAQPWDGTSMPGHEEAVVDRFLPPDGTAGAWGFAGPVSMDLAGFTRERIAANARDHGDTCPPRPEVTEPAEIGGHAGTFIAWNCGILINLAITVQGGVGYVFVMRDPGVHAATDVADRAIFDALLASVKLPG